MKKFIAGIVMSALLFMALAVPAFAGNKWGSRGDNGKSTGSDGGADVYYSCGSGDNLSRYWFNYYC